MKSPSACVRTFAHKLRPRNAAPDLLLVAHPGVRHEGFVEAWSEVGEAEGVVLPEVEEL